jgi:hypothetical protein
MFYLSTAAICAGVNDFDGVKAWAPAALIS